MARIPLLLQMFPDAKFIHIVRNLYDVFASSCRLWSTTNKYYALGNIKTSQIEPLVINIYQLLMAACLKEKDNIPQGNLYELSYESLRREPLKALENIYEKLALKDFATAKTGFQDYLDQNSGYRPMIHKLSAREKALIDKNWDPYFEYWYILDAAAVHS